eukprot:c7344_g1_i1.p1 GENE.c7344_g1_i1~~c7344_g1_i1.p1  ORF type:complete len:339 (-),score=80.44 c7344_g1_i1:20-1036(-)
MLWLVCAVIVAVPDFSRAVNKLESDLQHMESGARSFEEVESVFSAIGLDCMRGLTALGWSPCSFPIVGQFVTDECALTRLLHKMAIEREPSQIRPHVVKYAGRLENLIEKLRGKLDQFKISSLQKCLDRTKLYLNPPPIKKYKSLLESVYDAANEVNAFPSDQVSSYDDLSFTEKRAIMMYAHMGHEFNHIIATNSDSMINVEVQYPGEPTSTLDTMDLDQFAKTVQRSLARLPPYSGDVLKRRSDFFPFGVPSPLPRPGPDSPPFTIKAFLSTTVNDIAITDFVITPKATRSMFRDIRKNGLDKGMGEVLGMIGCRLRYVAVTEDKNGHKVHYLEEV